MEKKKYIYLATISFGNVFKTQIISWLNIYREYGIEFDLYKIESVLKKKTNELDSIKREIQSRYKGSFDHISLFPKNKPFSTIINTILLYKFLKNTYGLEYAFIIQTRSAAYWRVFDCLEKFTKLKIKVVFDSRAAVAAELDYVKNYKHVDQYASKLRKLQHDEINMVRFADHVFTVSNRLKEYFLQIDSRIEEKKFKVNPGKADHHLFYFSSELRKETRRKYDLENKRTILYSGGLEMPWHLVDQIFLLFNSLKRLDPEGYKFLVLTSEKEFISEYTRKNKILDAELVEILSVDNNEVAPFLNAADYGLILRENVLMNNVAAPTKFPEYLMCGLPVIISPGIGDYSEYTQKTKCGITFNPVFSDEDVLALHNKITKNVFDRSQIAESGRQEFSKSSGIQELIDIYKDI